MSVSHTWLRVVKHHLHDVVKFRILTVDRVVCLSSCSYSKTAALCTPLWTFKQIHFPHTKSGTRKRTKDKGRLVSLSRTYSFRIVSADYDTFAVSPNLRLNNIYFLKKVLDTSLAFPKLYVGRILHIRDPATHPSTLQTLQKLFLFLFFIFPNLNIPHCARVRIDKKKK